MPTWLINGSSPESLGLAVVSGEFNAGRASSVRLARVAPYDAAQIFSFDEEVTITRDGTAFFKGRCREVPKSASGDAEGHDYLIEDSWADLERTTYQEAWNTSDGAINTPLVILGIDSTGARITLGDQIRAAVDYAETSGVDIQVGSVPTGMMLWPTEANGMSCAEVIRESLRYHPDWLPWIDHTTTTPTFNVTARAAATARNVAVTACESINVVKTDSRIPDCVRIVYQTADEVGDDVLRKVGVDKWPTSGNDDGPGVLSTVVDLQGIKAQIQKQQIQTRHIPTTLTDSTLSAKAWLKLEFPSIKDIDDAKITLSNWSATVIPETETPPDPINPLATRLGGPAVSITLSDIPRQLVKGSIHEWMRRKVGRVRVAWTLDISGSPTDDERKKIQALPKPGHTVNATNATTKIYKGLSSWTAADAAPSGVAQAYYQTISNGCGYEGSIVLIEDEINPAIYHGAKLNLSGVGGGAAGWSTMAAPIHRVVWDLATARTVIDFGPTPDYSVPDFLEYLRLLNRRPASWMSSAERTSDKIGDLTNSSAAGDNVGPFETPASTPEFTGGETFTPFKLTTSVVDGAAKYTIGKGSITDGTNGTAINLAGVTETAMSASAGYVVIEATVASDLTLSSWAASVVSESDAAEVRMTTSGTIRQDKIRLLIGKLTMSGSPAVATAAQACYTDQRITHGFLNGSMVKVFETAPTHPTKI
jgi:hypothetical protein